MEFLKRFFNPKIDTSKAKVSEAEAIHIAQKESDKRGWTWLGSVKVYPKRGSWVIRTNWPNRGCIIRMKIDWNTGEILEAGYIPR